MKIQYIFSIFLVFFGVQSLVCDEDTAQDSNLTFEEEYDRDPSRLTEYFGKHFVRTICTGLSEEEAEKCKKVAENILPLLFNKMESMVPCKKFENKEEWQEWLQHQTTTWLMLSKSGCFPCAAMHAFLGNYVEKCRERGISIVSMNSKNVELLEKQGVVDLSSFEGTPEFYPIENGTVRQDLKINGMKVDELKEFLKEYCS